MKSIETLIRLSKNPNYKLSAEELQQLEDWRNEQFVAPQPNLLTKHSPHFKINDPLLRESEGNNKDGKDLKRG